MRKGGLNDTDLNRQYLDVLDNGSLADIANMMEFTGPRPEVTTTNNLIIEIECQKIFMPKNISINQSC